MPIIIRYWNPRKQLVTPAQGWTHPNQKLGCNKWARKKKRPYFPGYSVFNRDPYLKKQPIIAMELGRGFIPYIHKKPPGFFIELLKCCFFLSVGNISHPTPYTMGSSKPTNHTRHLPPTNHPFCVNSGRFSTEKVVLSWWNHYGGPPGPQPSG